jgi:transposase
MVSLLGFIRHLSRKWVKMAGSGKTKTGRPPIISPELVEKLVGAIRAGNYIETAAAFAGINKDTLYDWMKRGARSARSHSPKPEDEPYRQFSDAIEKALADSEVHDVTIIAQAARGGNVVSRRTTTRVTHENGQPVETTTTTEVLAEPIWQAAAWRLERKFHDRWGRKFQIGSDTSEESPFVIKFVPAEKPDAGNKSDKASPAS